MSDQPDIEFEVPPDADIDNMTADELASAMLEYHGDKQFFSSLLAAADADEAQPPRDHRSAQEQAFRRLLNGRQ